MSTVITQPTDYALAGWERQPDVQAEVQLDLAVEEILERTQALVDALGQLDDLGSSLAAMRTEYKKRRDALDEQVSRLRSELKDRRRKTKVKAAVWHDYRAGVVHLVDLATGRVVEERALTAEERQQAMPLPGPQAAAPASDDRDAPLEEGDVEPVLEAAEPEEEVETLDEVIDEALAHNAADSERGEVIDLGARRGRRGPAAALPPEPGDAPKRRGPGRRRV